MAKENKASKETKTENNQIEPMADFFNQRAGEYENHMRETVDDFRGFYDAISRPIPSTDIPLSILDLGCGTGLEIEGILKKAPNAILTCVDVSREMLAKLKAKYSDYTTNIKLVNGSYLTFRYESAKYDFIVSVMTIHHLEYDAKLKLYTSIRNSLKDGAYYIEGDYVVSEKREKEMLNEYFALKRSRPEIIDGNYHVDIPFPKRSQLEIFKAAGFSKVEVLWETERAAIFVAHK